LGHCNNQTKRAALKCISSDWVPYKDIKCIKVLNIFVEQMQGLRACQNELKGVDLLRESSETSISPASLLSIASVDEEEFVDFYLYNKSKIADNIWLSASKDSSGEFRWPDGTSFSLTTTHKNWAFANPGDTFNRSCVEMRSRDNRSKNTWTVDPGTWYSVPCSKHNLVVCQYFIRSLPSPEVMTQFSQVKKDVGILKRLVSSLETNTESLQAQMNRSKDDIARLTRTGVELQAQIDTEKDDILKLRRTDEALQSELEVEKAAVAELKKEVTWMKGEIEELRRMMTVLLENVITDIRFGKVEIKDVYKGHGYEDGTGYVITGAINWDGDGDIDTLERRRVQKFVNGRWFDVY